MNSRELKLETQDRLKGKWQIAFAISLFYVVITCLVDYLANIPNTQVELVQATINILGTIFLLPLSFGVTVSVIKLMKGETVSLTDFINIGLKNISNVWKVILSIFLKLFFPFLICIFVIFIITQQLLTIYLLQLNTINIYVLCLSLLFLIFTIIMTLPYVLAMFVLYDNKEKKGKEILKMSSELMKGNKIKYISLILSFIGWYILILLLLGISNLYLSEYVVYVLTYIPVIFLTPYITATTYTFYENLKNSVKSIEQTVEKTEENIISE